MQGKPANTQVEYRGTETPPAEVSSAAELIRSMALSSAELWNDVLHRLSEVQESQLVLAKAVAELGAIVKATLPAGLGVDAELASPSEPLALQAPESEPDPEVEVEPELEPEAVAAPMAFAAPPVETFVHEVADSDAPAAVVEPTSPADDQQLPEDEAADEFFATWNKEEAEEDSAEPTKRRFRRRRHGRRGDKHHVEESAQTISPADASMAPPIPDMDEVELASDVPQLPPPPIGRSFDVLPSPPAGPLTDNLPPPPPAPLPPPPPVAIAWQATNSGDIAAAPAAAPAPAPPPSPAPSPAPDVAPATEIPALSALGVEVERSIFEAVPAVAEAPAEEGDEPAPVTGASHAVPGPMASPLPPQPLVYTPSNAETSLPMEPAPLSMDPIVEPPVASPAPPTPLSFQPQTPPAPLAEPEVVAEPGPVSVMAAPVPPLTFGAASTPAPDSPSPDDIEDVSAPILSGPRTVPGSQSSASMVTEILGSTPTTVAPGEQASSEPGPLVVSEDLTLVSKAHRKRRFQFQLHR